HSSILWKYHFRKSARRDLLVSTRITLHLYQQLLDRVPTAEGNHMHTDRYYTSIPLTEELRKMKGVLASLKKPKLREKKLSHTNEEIQCS
ncbi:hypothetical protein M0804_015263, partial [Polistes exclamans]